MKVKCLVSTFVYIFKDEVYNVLHEDENHYWIEVAGFPMGKRYRKSFFEVVAAKLDLTKPVQTKVCAKAVRILCTDGPGAWPVVGLIDGVDRILTWDTRGQCSTREPGWSLVNVPPPKAKATATVKYYLIRNQQTGAVWVSRRKRPAHGEPLGVKEIAITITEGEGLDSSCTCSAHGPQSCGCKH